MVVGVAVGGDRVVGIAGTGGVAVGEGVVGEVEVGEDVVPAVDLVVEAREKDVLLADAAVDAGEAKQVGDGGGALTGRDGRRALGGRDGGGIGGGPAGGEGDVGRGGIGQGRDFAEAIVGEEVEQLVLDEGTADAAAKLLLLLDGLGVVAVGLP